MDRIGQQIHHKRADIYKSVMARLRAKGIPGPYQCTCAYMYGDEKHVIIRALTRKEEWAHRKAVRIKYMKNWAYRRKIDDIYI